MIKTYESYSRIPKNVVIKEEGDVCLINKIGDNKVLVLIHELYMGSNFRKVYNNTLDGIISNIGYKIEKSNRGAIRKLLKQLMEYGYIHFDCNIDKIKSDKMINIDVSNMVGKCTEDGYVELSDDELELIMNTPVDMRSKMGALKLYTYLKMKVNKNTNTTLAMGEHPEALYESYEFIRKNLGIKQEQAAKYVDLLEDIELITTIRGKYKVGKSGSWVDMPNIFAINKLLGDDIALIQSNLQFCLSVYKKKSEEQFGLMVVKKK